MAIDPTSYRKSLSALESSLSVSQNIQQENKALQDTLRSGVIQNFEVSYELAWKLMQRWLKENADRDQADFPRTRKDLFRLAAKHGLIEEPEKWFRYAEARNKTSHTYYEAHAIEVYEIAHEFLVSAKALLNQIEVLGD